MVRDWYLHYEHVKKIYMIKVTDEGRITAISQFVFELQKNADYRVFLTAIWVGGFALIAGVVIGKLWFGA